RDLTGREGLHRLAIRRRMADGCVAGHGFQRVDGPLVRPASEHSLRTAMLIAERDLQVKDLFAVALETEMARLDNAGVNRTDRDLVDFLPLDAVEVGDADDGGLARRPAPDVVAGTVRGVKANGLEPGVTIRAYAVLLGDLPLEQVD